MNTKADQGVFLYLNKFFDSKLLAEARFIAVLVSDGDFSLAEAVVNTKMYETL